MKKAMLPVSIIIISGIGVLVLSILAAVTSSQLGKSTRKISDVSSIWNAKISTAKINNDGWILPALIAAKDTPSFLSAYAIYYLGKNNEEYCTQVCNVLNNNLDPKIMNWLTQNRGGSEDVISKRKYLDKVGFYFGNDCISSISYCSS